MLNKINGRWGRSDQVKEFAEKAEEMIVKYGWEDRVTYPYPNCRTKVTKIVDDLKDYDNCTEGSQDYLVLLANGFADILNAWEQHELAPKVMIKSKTNGKIVEMEKELAEMFVKDGSAEYV